MKLHHFVLLFAIVAGGFFLEAQIRLVIKMQNEGTKKTEYDCLVAAVNSAVEAAFSGNENVVTAAGLSQAEEVFFQTLAVLHEGTTDSAARELWKQKVPCLALFDENGYYVYRRTAEEGYAWSQFVPYEDGKIPERFFRETEAVLERYHSLHSASTKRYRVEQAEEGVWERSIVPPCVFAVYAPQVLQFGDNREGIFLYAASQRVRSAFFVTEDNVCHLPFCEQCRSDVVVARYATQKESAEDGAVPCEYCLR